MVVIASYDVAQQIFLAIQIIKAGSRQFVPDCGKFRTLYEMKIKQFINVTIQCWHVILSWNDFFFNSFIVFTETILIETYVRSVATTPIPLSLTLVKSQFFYLTLNKGPFCFPNYLLDTNVVTFFVYVNIVWKTYLDNLFTFYPICQLRCF